VARETSRGRQAAEDDKRPAPVRLTTLSHGAGCACKLRQGELAEVMSRLPVMARPRSLMVGTETRDDAAVWKLDKTRALVATTDFFAPLVDDPRDYGRIAAANAISDIYAMGGRPLYALNLVGWPRALGFAMLSEVLAGGAEIALEADCPIVGGHSIDDAEPKYGLAVTGIVDPRRVLTNSKAKPGDVLLLGKALGTGIHAPFTWQSITVTRDSKGKPGIRPDAAMAKYLASHGIDSFHISLTDDGGVAMAFVVLEGRAPV